VLLFTTNLSSTGQFKIHIELLPTFLDESRESSLKPNVKLAKENRQNPLNTFQLSTFCKPACLQKHFHGRIAGFQCHAISCARYAEKLFPQIYRDLYGDAMLVPIRMGTNM